MGRKSKSREGGQTNLGTTTTTNLEMKGIPQSTDARKTKSMNVLQGIEPLQMVRKVPVTPQVTPIQSPNSAGSSATASGKSTWADMVDQEESAKARLEVKTREGVTWSRIVGETPGEEGIDLNGEANPSLSVKITSDDIKEEVEYWGTAVVCYVLGSNPPPTVMEGYFRRIWKKLGIDKVAQVNSGVFMVRFNTSENRGIAVEEGVQMFDKKPVIVKPWKPDIDVMKEKVDKVPIWV
ncbi:hypothetical protein KY284_019453 [Solanum tuberosum]|nr:hypothetical protein KY284_019453 [Solanum tuberosum]